MADRPDVLDRMEQWARDTLSVASVPHARDVLALVRVARAARVVKPLVPCLTTRTQPGCGTCDACRFRAALAELEADK